MRIFTALAAVALTACGYSYHPDYHPTTTTTYSQSIASPVTVQGTSGQPVYVPAPSPPPAPPAQLPAAPPPPHPPEGFPW